MSQFFPGPMVGHATLSGKWELTTCNAFSMLSGEMSTTSQSSSRTHTEGIIATRYHMVVSGFPQPMEPQALLPAGHPVDFSNCTADPVHDVGCLAVHIVYTVH